MNIGHTIRLFRLNRGMSQGDIERRTGLLPSYLSRIEHGHTVPSLDTLARIATALDVPIAQFFRDGFRPSVLPTTTPETRFLGQIRKYAKALGDNERKLIISMVKKMVARTASPSLPLTNVIPKRTASAPLASVKVMTRVLKMPAKSKLQYCPICGSRKLELLSERRIGNLLFFRFQCEYSHILITSVEEHTKAASGE